jgi:hypothetical protein
MCLVLIRRPNLPAKWVPNEAERRYITLHLEGVDIYQ